ncbi:hypothetical protein Golomagni_04494 [Golovinomyces magnicellulatus]|nr:hypothetical protein Golomagni_04494 [Golovinomyces magnicellulatus]
MSGTQNREAVFATRQSLGLMKSKLKGAQIGHDLLKRKSEALTKRFRGFYSFTSIQMFLHTNRISEITRRIDEAKRKMGRVMQIASFSLAEVTYAVGGSIGYQVQESAKTARFRLRTKQENVSGVFLPTFESYTSEGSDDFGLTGLGKGGQQVQRCRETYARAVETLVELASLQTAFVILDEVIKVVNRRVNAMLVFRCPDKTQSNVIPSLYHKKSKYLLFKDINSELDELDREEFFRLKKVQNKKQRDTAAQDALMKAKRLQITEMEIKGEGNVDVLGVGDDTDVIF